MNLDHSAAIGLKPNSITAQTERVILLFDLTSDGHHPGFLQYLAQYWSQVHQAGVLHIVVAPEFLEHHTDIVAHAYKGTKSQIQFTAVSINEIDYVQHQTSLFAHSWAIWNIFCKYATQLQPDHAVLMYVDSFQIPLALGRRAPCALSGIYFRPTFHYPQFTAHRSTWRDRVRAWRQKILLAQMLRHPQFKTLFSMDWLAVPAIEPFKRQVKVLPLADPITLYPSKPPVVEQIRSNLKIDPNRQVFLLFGKISRRKGVLQVLEALHHLSPETAAQICLLIVGRIEPEVRAEMQPQLASLADHPAQVILDDRYFAPEELQAYLGLADVIMAPYQRHIGTCATMLHAANAQKPVIVSSYGLMGELARQYKLGLVIDCNDIEQIAQAMTKSLARNHTIGNPEKMKDFATKNDWKTYATTVFEEVLR